MKPSFLELYDECFEDVYRYIFCKTGHKWDTDDLASEVFQKAYAKYHTVTRNPKAWLFTIARNALNDYYRRQNQIPTNEIEKFLCPNELQNREDPWEKEADFTCLKTALLCLEEEDLEIIKLRYFANLKYKEMSPLMGKDPDLLKARHHRILKRLRAVMKECLEG